MYIKYKDNIILFFFFVLFNISNKFNKCEIIKTIWQQYLSDFRKIENKNNKIGKIYFENLSNHIRTKGKYKSKQFIDSQCMHSFTFYKSRGGGDTLTSADFQSLVSYVRAFNVSCRCCHQSQAISMKRYINLFRSRRLDMTGGH